MKVPGLIYRLGRKPDPWSVPDWASAGPDGTFGNRFDDPEGMYRVLYASSQRLGCFLETLGRFRVDPKLLAELGEIEGEDDYCPLGQGERSRVRVSSSLPFILKHLVNGHSTPAYPRFLKVTGRKSGTASCLGGPTNSGPRRD